METLHSRPSTISASMAHLDMDSGTARMLLSDYGGLTMAQLHQQFAHRNPHVDFHQHLHKHDDMANSNAGLLQQHQQHQLNQRQQQLQHYHQHEQQQQCQNEQLESKSQRPLDPSQARPPGGKYLSRWTSEEDAILLAHVTAHGTTNWGLLKSSGLLPFRDNKACCNRFILLKKKFLELSPSAGPAMSHSTPSWADGGNPPNASAPAPSSAYRTGTAPTRGVMAQVGTASSPVPSPQQAVGAAAASPGAAGETKNGGGSPALGSSADLPAEGPAATSFPAGAASGGAEVLSESYPPKAQESPGMASATCSGTGRASAGCGSTTRGPCSPDDETDGELAGAADALRSSSLLGSSRGAASATGATGGGQAGNEWESSGPSHKRALSDGGSFMAAGAAASAAAAAANDAHSDIKRLRRFASAGRPPLRADVSPQPARFHGASLGSAGDAAGVPRAMSVDGKSTGGISATMTATATPGASSATTGGGCDLDMDLAMPATAAASPASGAATVLAASTSTSAVSALRRVDSRHAASRLCGPGAPRAASAGKNRPTGGAAELPPRGSSRTSPSADLRNLCNMLGLDASAPSLPSATASAAPLPSTLLSDPPAAFPLPPAGPSAHSQRRSNSPLQHASLRKHHTLPNHTVPSLLAKLRRSHGHASGAAGAGSGSRSGAPPAGSSAASVRQLMKALGLPPVPSPPQHSPLHAASRTALIRTAPAALSRADAAAAAAAAAVEFSSAVGGLQSQLHAKQQQQADLTGLATSAEAAGPSAGKFGFPTSVDGLFDWISQPVGSDAAAFGNDAFAGCLGDDPSAPSAAAADAARSRVDMDAWRGSAGAGLWMGAYVPETGGDASAGMPGGLSVPAADGRGFVGKLPVTAMATASPAAAAPAAGAGPAASAAASQAFSLSMVRHSYLESLKDMPGVEDMLPGSAIKGKSAHSDAAAAGDDNVNMFKAVEERQFAVAQERELLLLQQHQKLRELHQQQEMHQQLELQLQQQIKVEPQVQLESTSSFLSPGQLMFLQHQQNQQQLARFHNERDMRTEALKLSQLQQQVQQSGGGGGAVDYGALLQELLREAQGGREEGGRRPDHLLDMMSS